MTVFRVFSLPGLHMIASADDGWQLVAASIIQITNHLNRGDGAGRKARNDGGKKLKGR
jgi:hypothetical protein